MSEEQIAHPPVVSPEQWRAERVRLLEREKELTRQRDKLNADRRRLPMVKVEKPYEFDGEEGRRSLMELFEGKRQLVVQHFMFDPDWEKGCSGCTAYTDMVGDVRELEAKDTRFVLISRAPLPKLLAYRKERGWSYPWYSSFGSDFNYDFHVTLDDDKAPVEYNYKTREETREKDPEAKLKGEAPGISVFFRVGDDVFHTYSNFARGSEESLSAVHLLDLTPWGRQEDFEDSPPGWPQQPTYG